MKRREFLGTTIAGLAGAMSLSHSERAAGQQSKRPNIVLCMADDQGWGEMGYNGHPVLQTPNFDAMAAAGLQFDRFYAAHPVCSPTRASVMTGRHPNRMGCFTWGHSLRPQEITIAEALKTAGYTTGHFGKWHIGSAQKGSPVNPGASGFDEWLSAPNFFDNNPTLSREGVAEEFEGESSMVTVDAALDFIRDKSEQDEPFLAVVWFGSPHRPHIALERDKALYTEESDRLQNLYGEITAMDRAFGKLRDELQTLGIHQNTILWYCSDNGGLPESGATGGRAEKGSIYEGGLRVPAIIEWPERLREHRVTDVPCNTSDIYPTLLDIVGVEMDGQPPLDGISLTPLMTGDMNARPQPIGFWEYPAQGIRTPSDELMKELLEAQKEGKDVAHPELLRMDAGEITETYPKGPYPGHAAWLDWPWKLHRIQGKGDDHDVRLELYNLDEDPNEQNDLASNDAERADGMRAALETWQASVTDSLNGEDYS